MTLSTLDWTIVAAYFIVSAAIGVWYPARGGRSVNEYFLTGRSLPWWLAGTSMVATTFAADTPLAVAGLVARNGIAGNWIWWSAAFGSMLTVFFFARLWRRAGILTDVEFAELRYTGRPAAILRGFRALYLGLPINCVIMGWVNLAMAYAHSSIGPAAGRDIGQVARALAPRVPQSTRTLREAMATSLVPARLARLVIAIAGGVALLLASTGLYGLVYYTLEQRLKEIGIRLALGADRRRILELIVGSAMRLSAIGVVLGVLAALGAARFLSALMYGLSPFDPLTLASVSMAMLLISLMAALTGARRGLVVDPTSILRRD